jgi:hypothetical protein
MDNPKSLLSISAIAPNYVAPVSARFRGKWDKWQRSLNREDTARTLRRPSLLPLTSREADRMYGDVTGQMGDTNEVRLTALRLAYRELLRACNEKCDNQYPIRAIAVTYRDIRGLGVTDHLLQWMLYQGQLEHLLASAGDRAHGPAVPGLRFSASSAFCLTEPGACFARQMLSDAPPRLESAQLQLLDVEFLPPSYDKENRVFRWGRCVLKKFDQPAENQEAVLLSAEELGWPRWLDNPLPFRVGRRRKVRLHNTIKDLNRRQTPYLIHFKGDGTGTRIGWEYR